MNEQILAFTRLILPIILFIRSSKKGKNHEKSEYTITPAHHPQPA